MDPPKWRKFSEGKKGGAISRDGLTLPKSSLPVATCAPSAYRRNCSPSKVAARKCHLPGTKGAAAERVLSLPNHSIPARNPARDILKTLRQGRRSRQAELALSARQ